MRMEEKVSKIYDKLSNFESKNSHRSAYPVHKKIQFQNPAIKNIYQWIIKNISLAQNPKILDAGCGVGYGSTLLADHYNAKVKGLSLSQKEIQHAKAYLQEKKHLQVEFVVSSYDELTQEKFDLIVAIESLKHAPNLAYTIERLDKHLHEGGTLFIADDFWEGKQIGKLEQQLKEDWALYQLYKKQDYLPKGKAWEIQEHNMTALVSQKSSLAKELYYKYLLHISPNKAIDNIFRGGLALEQLFKKGRMSYGFLICKKSPQQ